MPTTFDADSYTRIARSGERSPTILKNVLRLCVVEASAEIKRLQGELHAARDKLHRAIDFYETPDKE